ncbi:hypothetical protein LEP1GSC052_2290 [Leptospira kmetyi serovar Malaysia str. Bejo-Iso9]|nr:hypothetical protein LEP1GSC052_2290 [Leptospira kmetyi serovar Malaysia str. Bejo-Iso9]
MDWAYVGTLAIMFEPSGFLFFGENVGSPSILSCPNLDGFLRKM